ncbi:MAG: hypothetical protein HYX89_02520, partial [Chloroflexi bacterium]|nr:hypothetical protein [Chloroflexota bacterium]
AAVEAIADERFNLYAIQATTNPVAPLLVINGPVAEQLDINSGFGCFGPGWRSNATIGRAIRLILMNVGGGRPGHGDMADQGQPGKYSFCIAENEKESPWPPLHVERGFDPNTSTVTAIAVVSVLNIMVLAAKRAEEVLPEIVGSMTTLGTNNLYNGGDPTLALCPEHAEVIARDGLSKDDVKHYIFEHARVPLSKLSPDNAAIIRHHREKAIPWAFQQPEPLIPIADRPEDIIIIVAGARGGPHSSYVSTFGNQPSVTKAIAV